MTEPALLTIGAELGVLDDDTRARLRAGVLELVAAPAPSVVDLRDRGDEPIVLDRAEPGAVVDLTDHQERRGRRDPRRQGHAGRRLIAAAAAILLLLVGGVALTRRADTGPDIQATLATPTTADELVAALRAAPDTPLPNDRYDFQRFEVVDPNPAGDGRLSRVENRWWLSNDSNRGRVTATAEQLLDSNAPGAARSPGLAPASDFPVTPNVAAGLVLPSELRALPTDVAALRAKLIQRLNIAADSTDVLHRDVIDRLSFHGAPPAVRAALVQLLVQDGATLLPDPVQDREGRSGLGLAVPRGGGQRTIVVLDPTTLFRLGDYTIPADGSTSADGATAWRTVLENTVRDTTTG